MARRRRRRSTLKSTASILRFLVVFLIVTVAGLISYSAILKDRPQDLPWTELKLDQPIGYFTGRKLVALGGEYSKCQGLLDAEGIAHQKFPATGQNQCRRDENISVLQANSGRINYTPKPLAPSCPVVAALVIWEEQIVQPAAMEHFGQKVVQIRHLGSFSCRPVAGTENWSEHATANAIDISEFVLADGRVINLVSHWDGNDSKARFLKQVRDGSCDLFATVLSPDYNAAHADHFHFDQASRAVGYQLCR